MFPHTNPEFIQECSVKHTRVVRKARQEHQKPATRTSKKKFERPSHGALGPKSVPNEVYGDDHSRTVARANPRSCNGQGARRKQQKGFRGCHIRSSGLLLAIILFLMKIMILYVSIIMSQTTVVRKNQEGNYCTKKNSLQSPTLALRPGSLIR